MTPPRFQPRFPPPKTDNPTLTVTIYGIGLSAFCLWYAPHKWDYLFGLLVGLTIFGIWFLFQPFKPKQK